MAPGSAYRSAGETGMPPHRFALRLYHPRKPIALSDILPLAENLGLRVISEAPFLLRKEGGDDQAHGVAMQVLRVETADKSPVDLDAAGPRFIEALEKLRPGALENGGLNGWSSAPDSPGARSPSCAPMRSICGGPASRSARPIWNVRWRPIPKVARLLVDLFVARFDPALGEAASEERAAKVAAIEAEFASALEAVTTLDEDRILRRFHNAVLCTCAPTTGRPAAPRTGSPSRSTAARSTSCRRRGRWSRSSSTARAWKASICAAGRSRAAASAGPTGARISAPRSWA